MSEGGPARRDPVFPAIGVISLAVLILELALTRLFSATLHYHFAFMAISLALLGSGSAGVAIYLAQDRLRREGWGTWGARGAVLFALTTVTALLAVLLLSPGVEGTAGNGARIAAIYVACALPFFCAGCAVTLAVMSRAAAIARLYRFDLAGAAAGCLLLVPLLDRIGGVNTILVVPGAPPCGGGALRPAARGGPPEAPRAAPAPSPPVKSTGAWGSHSRRASRISPCPAGSSGAPASASWSTTRAASSAARWSASI